MKISDSLSERVRAIAKNVVAEDEYDRYRDQRAAGDGDWGDMKDNRRLPGAKSPGKYDRPKARMIKQYLNVPYAEREEAKKKGAKWDPVAKKWYMPVFAGTVWSPYGYEHWLIK